MLSYNLNNALDTYAVCFCFRLLRESFLKLLLIQNNLNCKEGYGVNSNPSSVAKSSHPEC